MLRVCIALALAVLAVTCSAAPAADFVPSVPGFDGPLPFKLYSGYLDLPNGHHYHYMFAESTGADPSTAPVLMFMNGGPGASSLMFFFTEGGPLSTNVNSLAANTTGAPTLFLNPNSWTSIGSVLVIESPATVGFSYCDSPCVFNDTSTGLDNFAAIKMFFAVKFPEYASNPFFLTGESYAGQYIPAIVELIMTEPNSINLVGMAVGDGCIGDTVGTCSPQGMRITVDSLASFHMISPNLYSEIENVCTSWIEPNTRCSELLDQMATEAGNYYVYYVYDTCSNEQLSFLEQHDKTPAGGYINRAWNAERWEKHALAGDEWEWRSKIDVYGVYEANRARTYAQAARIRDAAAAAAGTYAYAPDSFACGGEAALGAWLGNAAVQTAIHINTAATHYPFKYTRNVKDVRPIYAAAAAKYSTLIYSGSADMCVPTSGSWEWTAGLGFDVATPWSPWYHNNEYGAVLGGYNVVYETNDFTFATIMGAGHECPTYRSEATLALITGFVNNALNN